MLEFVHPSTHVVDAYGTDQSVVRAARVSLSNDREVRPPEDDARLIRYLLKHGHWSPFEHAGITLHVEVPIYIARQWMRHKSHSFNEVSGRYTQLEPRFEMPDDWRAQSESNRQASGGDLPGDVQLECDQVYEGAAYACWSAYLRLLHKGVAREQARKVLPLSIMTRFYDTMNLRSAIHFIGDRDAPTAQGEIADLAREVKSLLRDRFPLTMAAVDSLKGAT